ncbi:hypothetical protein CIB95_01765 [Lottiidibacillus patelloidae]|uniref:Aminoglycoside phosphotransferase domain-containing protein n=1 Tax=Lottiidibacillus patelloidae TaxID=2670334 RepID=A0A263BXN0_9BACI|nr:hypothetical protein [Lottiidibacillus patelloidae]OZM58322.1 hypothetical protein CIB95_01765 [Lottiidibacillus patelloidae]
MELTWKEEKVSLDEVLEWIKSVTSATNVKGPEKIFRANDWGITAKFLADGKEVVCKIGFLPLFQTSPAIYQLLNGASNAHVPNLIKAVEKGQQTWMLFKPFYGQDLKESLSLAGIKEAAKTIASIQNEVSKKYMNNSRSIPKIEINELKPFCHTFLDFLEENYAPLWRTNTRKIAEDFRINKDKVAILGEPKTYQTLKASISQICRKLFDVNIPLSIFHLDLHTGNVVTLENGSKLIYDWEEAIITLPFFALSKLLPEAANLADEENISNDPHLLTWNAAQQSVINAYLKELNFNSESNKQHIFDLAMCLAPLIYANQSLQFIDQVGWLDDAAGFLAYDVILAFERMEELEKKGKFDVLYDS